MDVLLVVQVRVRVDGEYNLHVNPDSATEYLHTLLLFSNRRLLFWFSFLNDFFF